MNKWMGKVFLPSLFEKYQTRDLHYDSIIISPRQAEMLAVEMRTLRTCRVMEWDTREVTLVRRGKYNMLSFGLSAAERKTQEQQAEATRWENELDKALRYAERIGPASDSRKRAMMSFVQDLRNEMNGLIFYIEDPEGDPYMEKDRKRVAHIKNVLEILDSLD